MKSSSMLSSDFVFSIIKASLIIVGGFISLKLFSIVFGVERFAELGPEASI